MLDKLNKIEERETIIFVIDIETRQDDYKLKKRKNESIS
jgi:hypothetical protein